MNIIIVNNELYQVCGCDSNDDLHVKLMDYISEQLKVFQIEKNIIRNVIIAKMDNAVGRIEIANTVCLSFDIFLNEYVIWYLYNKNQNNQNYASAVIIHELFHCKDLSIVNTKININKLDKQSTNLTELYINLGLHQWGEYYAHFNSAKIHLSDIPKLSIDNNKLNDNIIEFKSYDLLENASIHRFIYEHSIHPFIKKIVILLANINSTNNKDCLDELMRYKIISKRIDDYINKVNFVLKQYAENYPNFISEEAFSILGKLLLEI